MGKSGWPIQNDIMSLPCLSSWFTSAKTTKAFSVPSWSARRLMEGMAGSPVNSKRGLTQLKNKKHSALYHAPRFWVNLNHRNGFKKWIFLLVIPTYLPSFRTPIGGLNITSLVIPASEPESIEQCLLKGLETPSNGYRIEPGMTHRNDGRRNLSPHSRQFPCRYHLPQLITISISYWLRSIGRLVFQDAKTDMYEFSHGSTNSGHFRFSALQ